MPNGCMHGSNCKYSHEDAKTGSIPKGKPKGKEFPPKGKGGPLAKAMVALVATAGSGPEYTVEWAADTAAGRHLGSHQALLEQGIPSSAFQSCSRATDSPVTFSTGGGLQPGVQTNAFHELQQHARGNSLDVAVVWIPGSLPFFVSDASKLRITCPEELKHYAVRVEEHVPIFESKVRFSRGLAATVSGGPPSHSSGGPFGIVRLHLRRPKILVLFRSPAVEDRLVPEGEAARVSVRVQALRDEAVFKEHQLFHFPKDPFCDTCNRAKVLASRFVVNHGQIRS